MADFREQELFESVSPWPEPPQYEKPQIKENDVQKYLPIALTIAAAIGRGTSGNRARRREAMPRAIQGLDYLRQTREMKKAEAEKGAMREYQMGMASYTDAMNRRKQDIDMAKLFLTEGGKSGRMEKEYGLKEDLAKLGSGLNLEEIEKRGEQDRKTLVERYGVKADKFKMPTRTDIVSVYSKQNPKMDNITRYMIADSEAEKTGKSTMDVYQRKTDFTCKSTSHKSFAGSRWTMKQKEITPFQLQFFTDDLIFV